ncbi:PIG-L deacetylase family protein [Variovorax sp. dw_308]|uniref:PIG-L deacetylase family protein n=1 Tax=Variovorax sp. dw_308 TaxID=2721546 RepID=UPI00210D5962|nr:PIG-L family deacetylase [Variovorax sp. dw_308]
MAALMDEARRIDASEGTPEHDWLPWLRSAGMPAATAGTLVPEGARAVVVAPHPDDEVLAVGGLLARLAALRRQICIIAVTDGTASHRGSTRWSALDLARIRPQESLRALRRLGVPQAPVRLGLPDGGLQALGSRLADALLPLLRPGDTLFTTWRLDGHPDHEATGAACADAAARINARMVEVPVWAWHWARPGDPRIPWPRARMLGLDADASKRKRLATQAFESQLRGDPSTGAGPVLRASTVARAARPFEVLFT